MPASRLLILDGIRAGSVVAVHLQLHCSTVSRARGHQAPLSRCRQSCLALSYIPTLSLPSRSKREATRVLTTAVKKTLDRVVATYSSLHSSLLSLVT